LPLSKVLTSSGEFRVFFSIDFLIFAIVFPPTQVVH
jgi:hypothetical protein